MRADVMHAASLHAAGHTGVRAVRCERSSTSDLPWPWILFFAAQIPVALILDRMPLLSTLHALGTVVVGLHAVATGAGPQRVAYVAAYITGSEVLWRMTEAHVFWEFGKYAVVLLFLAAMLRIDRWHRTMLPFLYFALLLPSTLVTVFEVSLSEARDQISFNVSGPLALVTSAWFFSHVRLSPGQLQRLLVALVAPAVGIASLTLFLTLTNPDVKFTGESNFATSGGFGPNQVSSVLGLGALLALFSLLGESRNVWLRTIMFISTALLAVQSAMTFSRGGLYNAAAGAILGALFLIRDGRSRVKLLSVAAVLFLVTHYVLLPGLDAYTKGTLSARFQDTDPTGRDSLVRSDLHIWAEHPVLGVGPGQAKAYRALHGVAAHTEFTRVLAEHGTVGLTALLLLLASAVRNVARPSRPREQALAAALLGWSLIYMVNAAMRLVAPSFVFGLSYARIGDREAASTRASIRREARRVADRGRAMLGPARSIVVRSARPRAHLIGVRWRHTP